MGAPRDTYKYLVKVGNKIVHGGITDNLQRRAKEWSPAYPNAHMVQVGRRTTREAALKWERDNGFQAGGPRSGDFR